MQANAHALTKKIQQHNDNLVAYNSFVSTIYMYNSFCSLFLRCDTVSCKKQMTLIKKKQRVLPIKEKGMFTKQNKNEEKSINATSLATT